VLEAIGIQHAMHILQNVIGDQSRCTIFLHITSSMARFFAGRGEKREREKKLLQIKFVF